MGLRHLHEIPRELAECRPRRFDAVIVTGGAYEGRPTALAARRCGSGFLPNRIVRHLSESRFDVIVIASSGPTGDVNAVRFPAFGEGQFLRDVLREVQKDYRLRTKILLTGYSRGAQFAHRFALALPEQVEAVAALASGTWTTPEGRLLSVRRTAAI